MNPLIEQAANWALDFANDLKPETQKDFIDSLASKAADLVHSSENEIDDKAALIFIDKAAWLLSETEIRIRKGPAPTSRETLHPQASEIIRQEP